MKKLFVYCPVTASKDAVNYFKRAGFEAACLTDSDSAFWQAINSVDEDGTLVLLSHGDASGPLMVSGNQGIDMTAEEITRFGRILTSKRIRLYLLSCHTGGGAFSQTLSGLGAQFAAPIGYAEVASNSVGVSVYSKEGGSHVGWTGTLVPARRRNATPLQIE